MLRNNDHSQTGRAPHAQQGRTGFSARTLTFTLLCLGAAATAYGQTADPFSTAATRLATSFTGPIARGFALVAIVIGGLELAFSEGGGRRAIGGLIFGLGLSLGAATVISWLFS